MMQRRIGVLLCLLLAVQGCKSDEKVATAPLTKKQANPAQRDSNVLKWLPINAYSKLPPKSCLQGEEVLKVAKVVGRDAHLFDLKDAKTKTLRCHVLVKKLSLVQKALADGKCANMNTGKAVSLMENMALVPESIKFTGKVAMMREFSTGRIIRFREISFAVKVGTAVKVNAESCVFLPGAPSYEKLRIEAINTGAGINQESKKALIQYMAAIGMPKKMLLLGLGEPTQENDGADAKGPFKKMIYRLSKTESIEFQIRDGKISGWTSQ